MHVLVTGATGLIGSAIAARLLADGHRVTGLSRDVAKARLGMPAAHWLALDMATATRIEHWLPHLAGIDAAVNCAGVLQDSPGNSTRGVHADGASALFAACEQLGVRRVVQVSAIGIDVAAPTAFSRSKREGDAALTALDLDWVILRPSVVLGTAAYGGSALIRGLAALPLLPLLPDAGKLQVVQLDDVVATVAFFLQPQAPSRITLDLAGPEALPLVEIVRLYRRWLGRREAPVVRMPRWAATLLCRAGDAAGMLGWKPPVRSTVRAEIARGAGGDPARWAALTGIVPEALAEALSRRPASVQERWFARLYLSKPVLMVVLALFWTVTGALSLGPAYQSGAAVLRDAGLGAISGPAAVAGGIADVAIGAAIALRRTARPALLAAIAVSLFYLVAGSLLLPRLWLDPLGPLVKVVPILVLHLIALAVLDDR